MGCSLCCGRCCCSALDFGAFAARRCLRRSRLFAVVLPPPPPPPPPPPKPHAATASSSLEHAQHGPSAHDRLQQAQKSARGSAMAWGEDGGVVACGAMVGQCVLLCAADVWRAGAKCAEKKRPVAAGGRTVTGGSLAGAGGEKGERRGQGAEYRIR